MTDEDLEAMGDTFAVDIAKACAPHGAMFVLVLANGDATSVVVRGACAADTPDEYRETAQELLRRATIALETYGRQIELGESN